MIIPTLHVSIYILSQILRNLYSEFHRHTCNARRYTLFVTVYFHLTLRSLLNTYILYNEINITTMLCNSAVRLKILQDVNWTENDKGAAIADITLDHLKVCLTKYTANSIKVVLPKT